MAWLNATPEESKLSRRDQFEEDNREVVVPDCDATYILDYLFELGMSMGDAALSHSEIRAWMENTGIELASWEARAIKRLSEAYMSESHAARKIDAETVWADAPFYMTEKWRKTIRLKNSVRKAAEI